MRSDLKWPRRRFLEALAVGVPALSLSTSMVWRVARAAGASCKDRYFVFAYFGGGWDTLMCIDPRDPAVFTPDRRAMTKIDPAYDRLKAPYDSIGFQRMDGTPFSFGPAIGEMKKHVDVMAVVNGVAMDTLVHEVGRRYFTTGLYPRGLNAAGSSVPTVVSAQCGDGPPIPNLAFRVETYNAGQPGFASGLMVNSVADLSRALKPAVDPLPPAAQAAVTAFGQNDVACVGDAYRSSGQVAAYRAAAAKARALIAGNLYRHFDFLNPTDPSMKAVRDRYAIATQTEVGGPEGSAATAAQALKNGVSQCVSLQLGGGLDTHDSDWETDHPDLLLRGMNGLASLVSDLKASAHPAGGTYIDRTTIIAYSEFARGPMINNIGGRDHHLGNSCILMGAGIKGGQVFGKTSDVGFLPVTIDTKTGAPSPTGTILTPKHVYATLLATAGLDYKYLRVEPLPGLLKT